MKTLKNGAKFLFPMVMAALLGAGCAGIPKTDVTVARISQPPPGKALVNFHRPSGSAGGRAFAIFDGNGKMLVDIVGKSLYQKVCDPGEQVFIGSADHVSVVKADLAPDKIYDIMVDISIGWVRENIYLTAVDKNARRRSQLAEFERREKLTLGLNTAEPHVTEYEAGRAAAIAQIKADFLGGPKANRLQHLQKDDCR
jgi:hypothetical protein